TGVGLVTPLGLDVESTWRGLIDGRSGVGPITRFDPTDSDTKFAAEVKGFEPERYVDRKEARRMDRYTHFVLASAREALDQAAFEIGEANAERVGTVVGSAFGGLETLSVQFGVLHERGVGRLSPFLSTMMLGNMAAGQVGIVFGARGPSFTSTSACASAAHAIGESFEIIRRGDADAMLAAGGEAAIVPIGVGMFSAMKALSTRNDC